MITRDYTPIEKGALKSKLNYLFGIEINGKKQPWKEKDGVRIYKAETSKYMDKLRAEDHVLLKNYEDYRWDIDRKTLYINGGDEGEFYITEGLVKNLVKQLGWE